jgi:hypothetical protein
MGTIVPFLLSCFQITGENDKEKYDLGGGMAEREK